MTVASWTVAIENSASHCTENAAPVCLLGVYQIFWKERTPCRMLKSAFLPSYSIVFRRGQLQQQHSTKNQPHNSRKEWVLLLVIIIAIFYHAIRYNVHRSNGSYYQTYTYNMILLEANSINHFWWLNMDILLMYMIADGRCNDISDVVQYRLYMFKQNTHVGTTV